MPVLVYKHGRRDQPKVALTFDDGPNPPRTNEIADILASHGVRATFFVLGKWVERWPDALEPLMRGGHVIGNHSYLHDHSVGDFDRAEAVLRNATGRPTSFLRAPHFNNQLCTQSQVALAPEVKIIGCDVDPSDWFLKDPDEIVRRCLDPNKLQGGSIIDLHDGSDNESERLRRPVPMVKALPRLIGELTSRGYKLVGLDEMELVDPTPV